MVRPPTWSPPSNGSFREDRQEIATLIGIAIISIVLWQSPWGGYLLYPLTILSTWFHEMGHGLAALALGLTFDRLVILPDGSGYALSYGAGPLSRMEQATIAASGLLSPTMAGCLLIVASRSEQGQRAALSVLAGSLALSLLLYVRSLTGWLVLPPLAIAAAILAARGQRHVRALAVQVLGVQGCISVYRDLGYLFSPGGPAGRSDTGQIEDALALPYWVWGTLITVIILVMVTAALRYAHRR